MPFPYTPKGKLVYGPEALLTKPELAAHIGAVATTWTIVEEGWGLILAEMLGADAKVGVKLYLELTGAGSQAAILRAVADERLNSELREDFAALLSEEKGRARERNRIVHGRWAIDPETPDGLILSERDWLPRQIAEMNHYYGRKSRNVFAPSPPPPREAPNSYQIYRERDFRDVVERLRQFSRAQTALSLRISDYRQRQESAQQELPLQSTSSAGLLSLARTSPSTPQQSQPDEE
jgi:hypothetical protein